MKRKFDLNAKKIAIILLGTVLNILGSLLADALKLPIWLDSVGTFLSAVLIGPVGGAVSGALMNIILNFFMEDQIWFSIVSIAGGLAVGLLFPRDRKIESFSVIATALFAGFLMTIVCTPLNMIFNGGYTGNLWGDALVDMTLSTVNSRVICCLMGGLLVNMPDKAVCIGIAMLLLTVIRRIHTEQSNDTKKNI